MSTFCTTLIITCLIFQRNMENSFLAGKNRDLHFSLLFKNASEGLWSIKVKLDVAPVSNLAPCNWNSSPSTPLVSSHLPAGAGKDTSFPQRATDVISTDELFVGRTGLSALVPAEFWLSALWLLLPLTSFVSPCVGWAPGSAWWCSSPVGCNDNMLQVLLVFVPLEN